ncbi:MAG: BolA family transcriptional regulator [Bdellovibrionales bacterium]|nr:BolA family transcriptional regulator [Oligoflexia bacterium]
MTKEELQARIETLAPETKADATDLTGTQDHWQVTIISPAFAGKSMVEQQRMVMGILKTEIDSNEVHALSMKTYTPEQFQKFGGR